MCIRDSIKSGAFRYAGSAHPSAVLWRDSRTEFEMLESQNPIIGFDRSAQSNFQQNETTILPGDKIVLYTDGLVEIEDQQNNPLGIRGLRDLIRPAVLLRPAEIADNVMDGMHQYASQVQRDDVYLLVLGLNGR